MLLTMRKELRFILRRVEFSICDTFRKIFKSSFSFSSDAKSEEADACNLPNKVNFRYCNSFFPHMKLYEEGKLRHKWMIRGEGEKHLVCSHVHFLIRYDQSNQNAVKTRRTSPAKQPNPATGLSLFLPRFG